MTAAPTPTASQVAARVRLLVATGSGLDGSLVIPGNDRYPSPTAPYASVLLYATRTLGTYESAGVDGTADVRYDTHVRSTFSVQWYRAGAAERAESFRAWAATPAAEESFRGSGLSVLRCGDITRLDEVVSSQYEERAGLDLETIHIASITIERDAVESVVLTTQADDGGAQEATIDGS